MAQQIIHEGQIVDAEIVEVRPKTNEIVFNINGDLVTRTHAGVDGVTWLVQLPNQFATLNVFDPVAFILADGTPVYHFYEDGLNNEPEMYAFSFSRPEDGGYPYFDIREIPNFNEDSEEEDHWQTVIQEAYDCGYFGSKGEW